jgi:anti-sigma B factor antagonist
VSIVGYSINRSNDTIVLELEGDIELFSIEDMRRKVIAGIIKQPRNLSIDLKGVTYIDSTGMSLLIEAKKVVENVGKVYRITNVPHDILQLFRRVSLDQFLIDNLDENT